MLLKYYLFACFCLLLINLKFSLQDDSDPKTALVESILKKLSSKINPDNIKNKKVFLRHMKRRLTKITKKFGKDRKKYLDLIMDGIMLKLNQSPVTNSGNSAKRKQDNRSRRQSEVAADKAYPFKSTFVIKQILHLKPFRTKKVIHRRLGEEDDYDSDTQMKQERILAIVNKLENFVRRLNDTSTPELYQETVNKLRKHLAYTAHRLKIKDVEKYTNLIFRGLDVAKTNVDKENARRMLTHMNTPLLSKLLETNETALQSHTTNKTISCDLFLKEMCPKLMSLRTMKCSDNETTSINVENICDGKFQCRDESDEWNCTGYVLEKAEESVSLMLEINQYVTHNCFNKEDSLAMLERNQLFYNIVKFKTVSIQKYNIIPSPETIKNNGVVWETVRKLGNNLANVVQSLSKTLNYSVCSVDIEFNINKNQTKTATVKDTDIIETTTWTPNSCVCVGGYCTGVCRVECRDICAESYKVGKWQCNSSTGNISITLDHICDGKLDCHDGTDEIDCTDGTGLARFQANTLFNYIQNTLIEASRKVPYEAARRKVLKLIKMIKTLQQLCVKLNPDAENIKNVRDEFIAEIQSIYKTVLYYSEAQKEMIDTYNFLNLIVTKLVNALKRSHTGNVNSIPSDGCYCNNGKCAVLNCTNTCIKACTGQQKLNMFFCDSQTQVNGSVPIVAVCNGTKECLGGEDESDCSNEICRNHHLVVLRNNLVNIGKNQKGTELGDTLTSWVKQATSTLMAAEKMDSRPTPADIKRVVNIILNDLVLYYSIFEEPKNTTNATLNQFHKAAKKAMTILKSCGQ